LSFGFAFYDAARAAMSAKVFISHASNDGNTAQAICSALESRGLQCWIASRDVGPGENFMESIVHAIGAAKVIVLVFSESANNSDEIKKEIVLAGNANVTVIPVRVEDVVPTGAFAYQLATRQWIDLFDNWETQLERLTARVGEIVSIEPAEKASIAFPPAPRQAVLTAGNKPISPIALSGNPLHHVVATFFLIVAGFLLIFLVSTALDDEFSRLFAGTTHAWDVATADCEPVSTGIFSGQCSTDYWSPIAVLMALTGGLIAIAGLISAALGTLPRKSWARFVGLGLCALGFAISIYLTLDWTRVALGVGFHPDRSLANMHYIGDAPSFLQTNPRARGLFVASIMSPFTLAFAASGAFYIWGWGAHLDPGRTRLIERIFLAGALVFCALAPALFFLLRIQNETVLAWTIVLILLEAIVFVWSLIRFQRELVPSLSTAIP
jgi:hypothetical protein